MKVSEFNGAQLDWAVAKAERDEPLKVGGAGLRYSSDWAVAGPIIEREKITLEWTGEDWMAYIGGRVFAGATRQIAVVWHDKEFFDSTPLIAAMRCYAASKLGDEIDISQELTTFKT